MPSGAPASLTPAKCSIAQGEPLVVGTPPLQPLARAAVETAFTESLEDAPPEEDLTEIGDVQDLLGFLAEVCSTVLWKRGPLLHLHCQYFPSELPFFVGGQARSLHAQSLTGHVVDGLVHVLVL